MADSSLDSVAKPFYDAPNPRVNLGWTAGGERGSPER
jgi:hypothetical protein